MQQNNIQIFNYGNNEVRTIIKDGEPWFVGKDVAEALGYKDTVNALKTHVDKEDKKGWRITTPSRGMQDVNCINEAGVYSLIFGSKLESAKEFKRWVTHEVLPDIRKHGMYMTDKVKEFASEDSEAFNVLTQKYLEAKGQVAALQEKIDADRAATQVGQYVLSLPGSIPVADWSNFATQHGIPNMGRNHAYKMLRDKGLVSKQKKRWNKPTQKGIEKGIVNLELDGGKMVFSTRTMLTPKGAQKLLDELFNEEYPIFMQIVLAEAAEMEKKEAV